MIDLKLLAEDELCQLIDLATEELALRRSGVPVAIVHDPDLPESIAAKITATLAKRQEKARAEQEKKRRETRAAWDELVAFVSNDLGPDLLPFADVTPTPPEGWEIRTTVVLVNLPGLCPLSVAYEWEHGGIQKWKHYQPNAPWRVLTQPGSGSAQEFKLLDDALVCAQEGAKKYFEKLERQRADNDLPF